ncbi:hypothetical protein ACS8YF_00605 [Salinisphaera sp. SWV1]|uniref:hypothetical protein n=1 Tax=Salinisphaera sp. SWV1 TaxID=3454139 RepID=UPI003F85B058
MDIPRGTFRTRWLQIAILYVLTATATGASFAADYASPEDGTTNTTQSGRAQPRRPVAPRASAAPAYGDLPHRGQTMAAVRARFGPPRSRRGPVGRPPITRWNYHRYHVYFEDNRVIHTVIPNHPEPLYHVDQLQAVRP